MDSLKTLPGDDVRQIMWRFSDRFDLQMLVQSARQVARGTVAPAVAGGARNSHEWTPEKEAILKAMDDAGLTAAFVDTELGGYLEGPKNMAQALITWELAWVDAGAATGGMAGNLALAPIQERGTQEQKAKYIGGALPPAPGENRKQYRGAFALTEPIPYVGVETGMLDGKVTIAEWKEGEEPVLHVTKRGRFITGMGFANFVTAAVASADDRIKGSCMIILEEDDPGTFNRGTATKKLVHQLSSTCDPVFDLKVPASRIVGGYTVKEGKIVPNYAHGEIIEAVFRKTRVVVGLMTAAKLLSAVEPVLRYQRGRFRGGADCLPGTPRYEQGLQTKEDANHRLIDVWSIGEAAASLGFTTARVYDELQPLEAHKDAQFTAKGITGRALLRALAEPTKRALEYIRVSQISAAERTPDDASLFDSCQNDEIIQWLLKDAVANVLCPATKLWNTGVGANTLREAVSLMGGYGITEDCPGFLGNKWMDSQLEATYEGPEAVQRRQLTLTMTQPLFLAQLNAWASQWRAYSVSAAEDTPAATGLKRAAGALANAISHWCATLAHLQTNKDQNGAKLWNSARQGITFPVADALCWLLADHCLLSDILELQAQIQTNPDHSGTVAFYADLVQTYTLRALSETSRLCTEIAYGYAPAGQSVPDSLQTIQQTAATLWDSARALRLAKDAAAQALQTIMIPEALDY